MKTTKKILYPFFILMLSFISCSDYLDMAPDENMSLSNVFENRRYTEQFLAGIYAHLPMEIWKTYMHGGNFGRNPYTGASDEMEITTQNAFSQLMNSGAWSPANVSEALLWSTIWDCIRKTNLFLENIHLTPVGEEQRNAWIGEATFLRAFMHFLAFRVHGPIPIMDRTYLPDEDFRLIVRQPLEDCVQFMVKGCDDASKLLPETVNETQYGRITKVAALALKARILLYAASPLFNGNPDYRNYIDPAGRNMFHVAYDPNKWQIAADAALECIKQAENAGHGLYYAEDNNPITSYTNLFIVRYNREVLFARNLEMQFSIDLEVNTSPNGMGGTSVYGPSQDLVDSYGMAGTNEFPFYVNSDGDPIYENNGNPVVNTSSGYDDLHDRKWKNREPRFYASIHYSGEIWRGRPLNFQANALDGKKSTGSYSKTGYLMKKFSSKTVDIVQGRYENKHWIYFRLGEQYLNYAEALNEAGGSTPHPDAFRYLNMIRKRAGMPDIPNSLNKDQLRTRIRHERKIELAFETHRFFDTRRWKIAQITDNGPLYGLNIDASDDNFYTRRVVETRFFSNPRHYLFPIPQDDINRSQGSFIQSPFW